MDTQIYLAIPYNHTNIIVRWIRMRVATYFTAMLMMRGFIVFSPITHSHHVNKFVHKRFNNHDFWLGQDFPILDWAHKLIIVKMIGWDKSYGIGKEIYQAKATNKHIQYLVPKRLDIIKAILGIKPRI